MSGKTALIILLFVLAASNGKTQTNDFELIETVKTDTGSKIVYLTALWCKPCMDKLDTVIKSFGGNSDPQLIILFDRYGYQQAYPKLKKLYDTSFFRTMPARYYGQPNGFISLKVNPGKKIIKQLNAEVSDYLSQKITIDDLWFGQAIYVRNKKLTIVKETGKEKIIAELKAAIHK